MRAHLPCLLVSLSPCLLVLAFTGQAPAADLRFFDDAALNAVQSSGVNAQVYEVNLPVIAGKLRDAGVTPAQFLNPVGRSVQTALATLNANSTEEDFFQTIDQQLQQAGVLTPGVFRAAGDPATNSVASASATVRSILIAMRPDEVKAIRYKLRQTEIDFATMRTSAPGIGELLA